MKNKWVIVAVCLGLAWWAFQWYLKSRDQTLKQFFGFYRTGTLTPPG